MFISFWETERDRGQVREGQREGHIESEAGSSLLSYQHRAQCRAWTHEPRHHELSQSWMLNRLSHPRVPRVYQLWKEIYFKIWFNLKKTLSSFKWKKKGGAKRRLQHASISSNTTFFFFWNTKIQIHTNFTFSYSSNYSMWDWKFPVSRFIIF